MTFTTEVLGTLYGQYERGLSVFCPYCKVSLEVTKYPIIARGNVVFFSCPKCARCGEHDLPATPLPIDRSLGRGRA